MCILVHQILWDEVGKKSLTDFALREFSNGDKKPHHYSKAIVDAAAVADMNISFNFRFIAH